MADHAPAGGPSGATPDRIELRGLRVVAICGALPEERERAQPLELDLDVEADLSVAGRSDALADTIDYGALCDAVVAVVEGTEAVLLEHLASVVADAVLAVDQRAGAVTVAVRKLRPPVPHALESSGVRVRRSR
jgi:dihydroneopterin aldolase